MPQFLIHFSFNALFPKKAINDIRDELTFKYFVNETHICLYILVKSQRFYIKYDT